MLNQLDKSQFNIEEGTITFWVKEGQVDWSDNAITPLFEISKNGHSIFILKDGDNKLKVFHVFLGKGRTNLEYDVSNLSVNERHFIVVTWSMTNRKIILYIDGKQKIEVSIEYHLTP